MRLYGVAPHRARPGPPALLLGYGSLTDADITAGVELLAALLGAGSTSPTRRSRRARTWDPAERSLEARLQAG